MEHENEEYTYLRSEEVDSILGPCYNQLLRNLHQILLRDQMTRRPRCEVQVLNVVRNISQKGARSTRQDRCFDFDDCGRVFRPSHYNSGMIGQYCGSAVFKHRD